MGPESTRDCGAVPNASYSVTKLGGSVARSVIASCLCACIAACEQPFAGSETQTPALSQIVNSGVFALFGTTDASSSLNPSTLLRLDPATGGHTLAGTVGQARYAGALAWNPQTSTLFATAKFTGANIGVIQEIDPASGIAVPVATIRQAGTPLAIATLAFTSDGTLWGTTLQSLGVIDLSNQSFSPRLALPAGFLPDAIDVAPNGLMYVVLLQFQTYREVLLTIDLSVPAIVSQRDLNSNFAVYDIAAAPDGFIYHTNYSPALFRIDPVTATVTFVGFGNLGQLGGIAAVPTDSDGDGVPGSTDFCPNTPAGAVVDADGCTLQQRIEQLAARVDALLGNGTLNSDEATGLTDKLTAALASINDGRNRPACGQLGAFVNQIEAFIKSGKLQAQAAADLLDAASALEQQIGC